MNKAKFWINFAATLLSVVASLLDSFKAGKEAEKQKQAEATPVSNDPL